MPRSVAQNVACAIIGSRLDYCNLRHVKHELPEVRESAEYYCKNCLPSSSPRGANITQSTFLRISIGYRCVAESTTRLPYSVMKPSNFTLLLYSHHIDSRVSWGHLRQTYCQLHRLHQQTWLLVGSHAAPHRLEQFSVIVRTADMFH